MNNLITAVILTVFLNAVAYMTATWFGIAYERTMLYILSYSLCHFMVVVAKAIGGGDDE